MHGSIIVTEEGTSTDLLQNSSSAKDEPIQIISEPQTQTTPQTGPTVSIQKPSSKLSNVSVGQIVNNPNSPRPTQQQTRIESLVLEGTGQQGAGTGVGTGREGQQGGGSAADAVVPTVGGVSTVGASGVAPMAGGNTESPAQPEPDCDYFCGCGKQYKSYAALFTHCKLKHDSKFYGIPIIRKKNGYFTIEAGSDIHLHNRAVFQPLTPALLCKLPHLHARVDPLGARSVVQPAAAAKRVVEIGKGEPQWGLPEGFIPNDSFARRTRAFAVFLESLAARVLDEPYARKGGLADRVAVEEHLEEDSDAQFVLTANDLGGCRLGSRIHFGPGSPEEMFNHFPLEWFPDARLVQPIWDGLKHLQNFLREEYGDVLTAEVDLVTRDYEMNITSTLCLFLIFVFPQVSSQFYRELVVLVIALRYTFNQSLQESSQINDDYLADTCDPGILPEIFNKFLNQGKYKFFVQDRKLFIKTATLEYLKPTPNCYNRVVTVCKYFSDWLYHFNLTEYVLNYQYGFVFGYNPPVAGMGFMSQSVGVKSQLQQPNYQYLAHNKPPVNRSATQYQRV